MEHESMYSPCRVIRVKFHRTRRLTSLTDQARRSAAALWNDMVRLHKRIRQARWTWPTQSHFDAHYVRHKARYPRVPCASIQQVVRKFFGNLKTTRKNRQNGMSHARYPWRDHKRFATVPYRGDLVHWAGGYLTLGGGNGCPPIVIPMRQDPGQVLKAELRFDEVLVTVRLPAAEPSPEGHPEPKAPCGQTPPKLAAGDPGQRWAWTILTEDSQSLMLNPVVCPAGNRRASGGRGLVSEKIRRAKKMGHLQAALASKRPPSRRYRKLTHRPLWGAPHRAPQGQVGSPGA